MPRKWPASTGSVYFRPFVESRHACLVRFMFRASRVRVVPASASDYASPFSDRDSDLGGSDLVQHLCAGAHQQSHCFFERSGACSGLGARSPKMGCSPPRPHSVADSSPFCRYQCLGRLSSSCTVLMYVALIVPLGHKSAMVRLTPISRVVVLKGHEVKAGQRS